MNGMKVAVAHDDLAEADAAQMEPHVWPTLASTTRFRNRWIHVVEDRVRLPAGETYTYTRLEPPGIGVGIIGFNRSGEVLLEREYRHGVGEIIWQLPGGLATPGEELVLAGLRELREETGYAPARSAGNATEYLGMVWDNPAFGPGQSHIYAAWDLEKVAEPKRDTAEYVSLHWRPAEWLLDAVRTGEIHDRVLAAAVGYLLLNRLLMV